MPWHRHIIQIHKLLLFSFTSMDYKQIARAKNVTAAVLTQHDMDEFYETEQVQQSIMECVRLLEQLFPEKVVLLCRTKHCDNYYASGNCLELWGLPAKRIERYTADDLVSMVYPE